MKTALEELSSCATGLTGCTCPIDGKVCTTLLLSRSAARVFASTTMLCAEEKGYLGKAVRVKSGRNGEK